MPYLLLTFSALFWSGNFVLSRGMNSEIPPIALSFWRWTTALLLLLLFTLPCVLRQRKLLLRHKKFILIQGLLGVAGFNTLIYLAVQQTTAINAALVNSCTPVIIVVFSWLLHSTRISRRQLFGVLLSLSGVAQIISHGNLTNLLQLEFNHGDLLVFAAAICWAFYSVNLKRYPKDLHPLAFQTATFGTGVIVLLPCWLMELAGGQSMNLSPGTLFTIAYVAIFASILAFLFWNRGVTELGANIAGPFIHLMPVFSTALAVIFLGENLTTTHMTAVGFIFGGILLTTIPPRRQQ